MSRTGFHGPIGVRAIEVRPYITNSFQSVSALLSPRRSYSITYEKPLYMFEDHARCIFHMSFLSLYSVENICNSIRHLFRHIFIQNDKSRS